MFVEERNKRAYVVDSNSPRGESSGISRNGHARNTIDHHQDTAHTADLSSKIRNSQSRIKSNLPRRARRRELRTWSSKRALRSRMVLLLELKCDCIPWLRRNVARRISQHARSAHNDFVVCSRRTRGS
jgi:hypothetical protein